MRDAHVRGGAGPAPDRRANGRRDHKPASLSFPGPRGESARAGPEGSGLSTAAEGNPGDGIRLRGRDGTAASNQLRDHRNNDERGYRRPSTGRRGNKSRGGSTWLITR